jgi:hypothetical protein
MNNNDNNNDDDDNNKPECKYGLCPNCGERGYVFRECESCGEDSCMYYLPDSECDQESSDEESEKVDIDIPKLVCYKIQQTKNKDSEMQQFFEAVLEVIQHRDIDIDEYIHLPEQEKRYVDRRVVFAHKKEMFNVDDLMKTSYNLLEVSYCDQERWTVDPQPPNDNIKKLYQEEYEVILEVGVEWLKYVHTKYEAEDTASMLWAEADGQITVDCKPI